jgi:hypothetical protein
MKSANSAQKPKDAKTTKQRGTTDDIELIKLILEENPALKKRILEQIRVVRALSASSSKRLAEKKAAD